MNAYNSITTTIFDVILAPFGHGPVAFDLIVWSVLSGVVALVIFKYISNQKAIERVKGQIKMHLLEIRLFRHSVPQVLLSTVQIVLKNTVYIGHNLFPMVVLMVPFMTVMVQLVSNYAYDPAQVGDVSTFEVTLAPDSPVKARDVQITLPDGVILDDSCGQADRAATPKVTRSEPCPPPVVHTADGEIFWRLKATAPGDHVIRLEAGDETIDKTWSVGGDARKIGVMKTTSLEGFLYPGEPGIPSGSAFSHLEIPMPMRSLPLLPDGEIGILLAFMVISLAAGFALKDALGVTL